MRSLATIALILTACLTTVSAEGGGVVFSTNQGQWPAQVLYRAQVPGGVLFVERDALTWVLTQGGPMHRHGQGPEAGHHDEPFRAHAYRVTFEGGGAEAWVGQHTLGHYENHFIGNDPTRWAGGVAVHRAVLLKELYPGIDLRIDGRGGLKYEFHVAPGSDPSKLVMRYDGQDGLFLRDGALVVVNSTGEVIDSPPTSWQETPEGRRAVFSAFQVHGKRVGFELGAVDNTLPLVIDPVLTFASYIGATSDNFGFTATYDDAGHLYGAGIVFGFGYPTTLGVVSSTYAGGVIDIGVSKFSPDGTSLIWSTYLGGSLNESPHSLVVNSANELFILGSTGSQDFPTTPGCFDPSFNGGPLLTFGIGYGYAHPNGCDIFLTRLNAAGTALLGSTYIGGTGNDGINNSPFLLYNYGDSFRGEVALDPQENPVVATTTESVNMPVSPGAPQGAFGGGLQDGYVFRMNPGLTTLLWATYLGGSGDDSAFGVQFDSAGDVFVTGGTTSNNLPMAGQPFDNSANGGVDGYIMRFNAPGNARVASTYLGTAAYDQCYFVQLDTQDNVYVVGQTRGNYPVTPGKYANPGSSQFIHKLGHDLSTSLWSTRIGNGSGVEDISPCAFLVSNCGQIYFSGWGGSVNNFGQPTSSSTTGLPTSPGAFQTTTDGSDFYLMVLEPDAIALNYATFFGGSLSNEHVDGGTSRFDKNGNVYQAVCAGCGSHDDFPTTPGAWSNTNNSTNCNLGVFKFALTQNVAIISIGGPGYVCHPAPAQFVNQSNGGNSYFWDFGDGNTSTDFAPSHTYAAPGIYVVTMVLDDTLACTTPDTATIVIEVVDPQDAAVDSIPDLCPGASIQLQASGGTSYTWSPTTGLSDPSIPNPVATPSGPITYTVTVTDQCGSQTLSVDVVFSSPNVGVDPAAPLCAGGSTTLSAWGGATYSWSPANLVNDPSLASPTAFPPDTTWYFVDIVTTDGCEATDSVLVIVQFGPPVPQANDTAVCVGFAVQLNASGGDSYTWLPAPGISQLNVPDPVVTPQTSMFYVVQVSNACGTTSDSVFVEVIRAVANAWPDTLICSGASFQLGASGGVDYQWSPPTGLSDPFIADPMATVTSAVVYTVLVTDAFGCQDSADVSVTLFPVPTVEAGPDQYILFGTSTTLTATGDGSMTWSPPLWINDTIGPTVVVWPETSTTYTVTLTDTNGCKAIDQVTVFLNSSLYVPNTFTPNADGINDQFFALGKDLRTFRLYVFNRWGEKIFETERLEGRWDGTYQGVESPIDTYVWRVDYSGMDGKEHTLFGHVNLVR